MNSAASFPLCLDVEVIAAKQESNDMLLTLLLQMN